MTSYFTFSFSRLAMDSYDDMNRVLITDDVDSQCVDMLVANGFSVEKDIKLAKQPQEQLIKRVQVLLFFLNKFWNQLIKSYL